MKSRDLELKLRTAVDHAAPRDVAEILSGEVREREPIVFMEEKRRRRRWPIVAAAACLALVLLGVAGTVWQENYAVSSVISLDVNPSIELRVNRRERVLSCAARSEDAVPVLADMSGGADLEGAKLDVAMNALVGALVRNGYLDSLSSTLLIAVEDNNTQRGERLQRELETSVGDLLTNTTVLGMSLPRDDQLKSLAERSNISEGKAAYVERVRSLNEGLDFDSLASLTMEELRFVMESGAAELPIGKADARRIAQDYAGLSALTDLRFDVDLEFSRGTAYYEVEIEHPSFGELEYWIDALTGEVLRGAPDILAPPPASPSVSETAAPAVPAGKAGYTRPVFDDDWDDRDDDDDDDDNDDDDDD